MIGWTNGCRPGRGKNSRAFFLEGVAGTFASAAADASVSFVADLEDTLEVDEVLHQAVRDPEDLQETARGLQSLRDYGLGDEAVAPYAREGAGKQPRLRVPFFSTGCHQPWIAPPSSGKDPSNSPSSTSTHKPSLLALPSSGICFAQGGRRAWWIAELQVLSSFEQTPTFEQASCFVSSPNFKPCRA
ncbi:hypothetical protein Droror1_Dr00028023 [Drosera rotundifolia]